MLKNRTDVIYNTAHIGYKNPYRYRGYRYDNETGMYYLQSRYYIPGWGRFINADTTAGKIGDLLSHNLFAYCKNNPVNMTDPTGHWGFWSVVATVAVVTAVVVVAVVAPEVVIAAAEFALEDGVAEVVTEEATADIVAGVVEDTAAGIVEESAASIAEESAASAAEESAMAEDAACESEANCFIAGTLVTTVDGEKSIENIKQGDKVLSENPETGQEEYKEVKQTFVHEVDTLVHVSIGDTKLDTTEGHKFWVVDKGWVEAKDLKVGDKVLEASGKVVTVTEVKVEKLKQKVKVYNFEVADFHTYFVSNIEILVHNTCGNSSAGDESVKTHGHHSDPKYLGGDPEQRLTNIKAPDHMDIHREIDEIYPRYKGKSYFDSLRESDPDFDKGVYNNLSKIYNKYSEEYPDLIIDFENNFYGR